MHGYRQHGCRTPSAISGQRLGRVFLGAQWRVGLGCCAEGVRRQGWGAAERSTGEHQHCHDHHSSLPILWHSGTANYAQESSPEAKYRHEKGSKASFSIVLTWPAIDLARFCLPGSRELTTKLSFSQTRRAIELAANSTSLPCFPDSRHLSAQPKSRHHAAASRLIFQEEHLLTSRR
jgi:hypothetical protein